MVKKLFYVTIFMMVAYTGYMIRIRPGQIFINSQAAKENIKDTYKRDKTVASTPAGEMFDVKVVRFSGDVRAWRGGREIEFKEGLKLRKKDRILTAKSSVAILRFAGNSTIKLFSISDLTLTKIQRRERSADNLQFNLFHLNKGAVLVDFVNQGKAHFLEFTSRASKVQVRGTQFLFMHNLFKDRSQLAVLEGVVKIYSKGNPKSKFVLESQGIIAKKGKLFMDPVETDWVSKINWPKLAKGSGIDLYEPNALEYVTTAWKRRRKQKMQSATASASKSKVGSMIKLVTDEILKVGGGIVKKGASAFKKATPVGKIDEAAKNIQNFEQVQKKRINDLDSLEE